MARTSKTIVVVVAQSGMARKPCRRLRTGETITVVDTEVREEVEKV